MKAELILSRKEDIKRITVYDRMKSKSYWYKEERSFMGLITQKSGCVARSYMGNSYYTPFPKHMYRSGNDEIWIKPCVQILFKNGDYEYMYFNSVDPAIDLAKKLFGDFLDINIKK